MRNFISKLVREYLFTRSVFKYSCLALIILFIKYSYLVRIICTQQFTFK